MLSLFYEPCAAGPWMSFTEKVHYVDPQWGEFCQKHKSAGSMLSFIVIVTLDCYSEHSAGKPLSPGPVV